MAGCDGMLKVSQPLDEWAENLLDAALQRHTLWCTRHGFGPELAKVKADLSALKLRIAVLVAFMAGSGVLGGATGVAIAKWIGI